MARDQAAPPPRPATLKRPLDSPVRLWVVRVPVGLERLGNWLGERLLLLLTSWLAGGLEVQARNDRGVLHPVLRSHAGDGDAVPNRVLLSGLHHVANVAVVLLLARREGVEVVLVSHAVSGPVSAPELDGVIVGAGGEDVARWVPGETPHNVLVSRFYHASLLLCPDVPVHDAPVIAPTSEHSLVYRVPLDTAHFLLVSSECLHFLLQVSDVEKFEEMIPTSGEEPVAVFVPGAIHHSGLVGVYRVENLAGLGLPQLDGLLTVFTAADDNAFLGVPVTTLHVRPVTPQHLLLVTTLEVPYPNLQDGNEQLGRRACFEIAYTYSSIIRAGSKFSICGTEGYTPDGFLVRLEHLDIVHVTLPVLDVSTVVPRHHPHIIVAPLHGPHRHVVSLQDCLKVESQTIPQSELSTGGSRDQSAALGCPGQTEYRTPHLVGGCFHKPRSDGVDRIVEDVLRWHNVWIETDVWLDDGPVPVVSLVDSVVQHVDVAAVVIHRLPHHCLPESFTVKLHWLAVRPNDRGARGLGQGSRGRGELWYHYAALVVVRVHPWWWGRVVLALHHHPPRPGLKIGPFLSSATLKMVPF